MRAYFGSMRPGGEGRRVWGWDDGVPFVLRRREELFFASRLPFDWGKTNAPTLQLAVAILVDAMEPHYNLATSNAEAFCLEVVSQLPDEMWCLTRALVVDWLLERLESQLKAQWDLNDLVDLGADDGT